MIFSLRPISDADYDFLYQLQTATMKPYIEATFGWDEAVQRLRFRFDPREQKIIVVENQDVGVLGCEELPKKLFIGRIQIAPAWQRRGLGTLVLRERIERARELGVVAALRVLKVNPAKRLYERLGFAVVEETATHYLMELR
jgi:GNAT superfamily N-acetyltransferase